eukprot:358664-Chlamydomonas_euryale.AAC.4
MWTEYEVACSTPAVWSHAHQQSTGKQSGILSLLTILASKGGCKHGPYPDPSLANPCVHTTPSVHTIP